MAGKRMDLWDEMQGTMDAALIKKIAIITMLIDHACDPSWRTPG